MPPSLYLGGMSDYCALPVNVAKTSRVESDESVSIWSFIIVPSPMHHLFNPESMRPVGHLGTPPLSTHPPHPIPKKGRVKMPVTGTKPMTEINMASSNQFKTLISFTLTF